MPQTEDTLSSSGSSPLLHLPPGFRFHPTDEELVVHYLAKKADSKPFPMAVIAEVDLYKFNPWDLPDKAYFGEREWYFFTPRDRKYPKGARPNRAASSGYWKATGTDKPIYTGGHKRVGVKKALVFYDGKAPKGVKSNWIMHEYRLAESSSSKSPSGSKKNPPLRLDDSVLCRIYEKTSSAFKVMVPVPARRLELKPDPEPGSGTEEVEFEQEAEAEPQKQEPGLDEMLASLPDLDVSRSQLGTHHGPRDESLEDFLNGTATTSDGGCNRDHGLFQASVEYAENSFQGSLVNTGMSNKQHHRLAIWHKKKKVACARARHGIVQLGIEVESLTNVQITILDIP